MYTVVVTINSVLIFHYLNNVFELHCTLSALLLFFICGNWPQNAASVLIERHLYWRQHNTYIYL